MANAFNLPLFFGEEKTASNCEEKTIFDFKKEKTVLAVKGPLNKPGKEKTAPGSFVCDRGCQVRGSCPHFIPQVDIKKRQMT